MQVFLEGDSDNDGVPWTAMGFNATDTVCFGRKQISKLIT